MINELLLTVALLSNNISYISTPKGSTVTVYTNNELSSILISQYNQISDAYFTSDIRISDASKIYNNYSYTFYSQNIDENEYCIDDAYLYINDGSYIEVPYSQVQVRDRIVYFDEDDNIVHSGVVRGTTGQTPNGVCGYSNTVWVQSKWGYYGLYEHRGDQCLYTSLINGGTATYVKFYRYNMSHTHSYSYDVFDSKYHYSSCECGEVIVEHTFELQSIFPLSNEYDPNYIPSYVCTYCGYVSRTGGL